MPTGAVERFRPVGYLTLAAPAPDMVIRAGENLRPVGVEDVHVDTRRWSGPPCRP